MDYTMIEQEQIRRDNLKAQKEAIISLAKNTYACGFVSCYECLFNIATDRAEFIECAVTKGL